VLDIICLLQQVIFLAAVGWGVISLNECCARLCWRKHHPALMWYLICVTKTALVLYTREMHPVNAMCFHGICQAIFLLHSACFVHWKHEDKLTDHIAVKLM